MKVQNKDNIGNPNHDDSNGRFTSEGSNGSKTAREYNGLIKRNSSSRKYVPKLTSRFQTVRMFVDELSKEEKNEIVKKSLEVYGYERMAEVWALSENPTIAITTPERIKFRENVVNAEIEKQSKDRKIKKENKIFLVLGLPASGKSTLAEPLMVNNGAYIIDADIFKDYIPEFINNKNAVSQVHGESVKMADDMLGKISDGSNIVIGKVGGHADSIKEMLEPLAKKGYKVNVVLNDLPFDVAIERNFVRFNKPNSQKRIVPISTILDSDGKIFDTYDELMKEDYVVGGAIYSNDVPEGKAPIKLKSDKEKIII